MNLDVLDLADQSDRTLIKEERLVNIFVEAGAGSGKTHELVERILALVDNRVELKNIAAITFTEKAAGELRARVRRRLAEDKTPIREVALAQLDTAPIGTIHSFAARIISEHPIEAGVPPLITVVDELRSQIAFTRRWELIRQQLFSDPTLDDALRVLLAVGASLNHLETLASALDANWDRLESHPPQRRPIPAADLGPLLRQTAEVLDHTQHCSDADDLLLVALEKVRSWHGRLQNAGTGELVMVLEILDDIPLTPKQGKKGNWAIDITAVRDACAKLGEAANALRDSFVAPAVDTVTAAMAELFVEAARERQRSGELEYNDLLIHARDLLVGTGQRTTDVHRALRERYRCIMLDEFQDTDPVQAEIATRITATTVCGVDDWQSLVIPAGRLFTVGDPKQSIYRFRRADIATYLDTQRRFERNEHSRIASLRTNFRSTDALLDWINTSFSQLIQANGNVQPPYQLLTADPARPAWDDTDGPAVSIIGREGAVAGESGKVSADEMRKQEAADVAAAILLATGRSGEPAWLKQAKRSEGFATTPLRLKDVTILLPTRTALTALEDALDDASVEYRAEASSLVYSTQEVNDLLLALKAVANTADTAALVLCLRSAPFGCGDDELFEWKTSGGSWNLFAPAPAGLESSPVAQGIEYLSELCRQISVLTPAELMDTLVTERRMMETAIDSPRYRDVWRRLRFVIDQARAWSEATHGSLRDYLVWAGTQQEENTRVREAVVPETDVDAVRIMTIHASKGLEFPMVILAGTGSAPRTSYDAALWDADGTLHVSFVKGITSAGYGDAQSVERQFNEAERCRLLYVACTRAESHLVLSYYTNSRSSLGQLLQNVDDPAVPSLELPPPSESVARRHTDVQPVQPWDEWNRQRAEWQASSAIVSTTSVTALAKGTADGGPIEGELQFLPLDDETLPSPAPANAERGAEFGTALHRVMELSDLQESADVEAIAGSVALLAHGVTAPALAARARAALSSEPVRRAAQREHWLELPVVVPRGGVTVEGVIDLMYREDDGTLVIADFKTDSTPQEETIAAYWRQLSTYADMVQGITGQSVSRLALIFCRDAGAEVMYREAR
ncbi:UvrD-helicase domain-containing protein [Arthrobacter sp. Bz4]|uniref:UvrD-helicase domain-containing protein n=1 Tax=Arthrobacter sp. Bz4 TaxID=2171979 RepID=UPI000D50DCA8|nr:UvrD-helicase domain-containing protein [Arthrobacter sp. Bz4]PVE19196.1 ATP-dependent DNA helicase [Arthrobacter sp. Bz4]